MGLPPLVYFTPWYLFILPVNAALIVGIAFMDWPAKTTWEPGWRRRSSGQLSDERFNRLSDLGVVPEEPMTTAFDADELGARDAGCRLGRESIWRERRVVSCVDDQGRNGDLLEGEPVRGEVRDEPVEDSTLAPGFEGEVIASASRGEGRYLFGLPIIRV
jgi:hypothetical protein